LEDVPRQGDIELPSIKGWRDCGLEKFPYESPPDIHPLKYKAFGVSMRPQDGETYLGMVVRYNETFESLSQKLMSPLKKDKCYFFSTYLARSDIYNSPTARSPKAIESFDKPVAFLVWGGNEFCEHMELLGISDRVENIQWQLYEFTFVPSEEYNSITIEAYYSKSVLGAYNGNIMVDNLSPIIEVSCK